MKNTTSLNTLYADYSAGLLEKRGFEGEIFKTLHAGKHRLYLPGLSREDRDDYISWLYPRISRAISAYQDTGSSFEAYIGTLIRMSVKEYRMRQVRSYVTESSAWIAQIPDMYACESEPQYNESVAVDTDKPVRLRNHRQHLILVLKCCNYVSDDFLEKVSPKLGLEPEVLRKMVGSLREMRVKREREIDLLRERAACQFFRCIVYERSLRAMPDNCITAQRLKERLKRGRNRLANMRKQLTRARLDPSHRQIAKILGIAKGTVDSALHNLKLHDVRYLENGQNQIVLN